MDKQPENALLYSLHRRHANEEELFLMAKISRNERIAHTKRQEQQESGLKRTTLNTTTTSVNNTSTAITNSLITFRFLSLYFDKNNTSC